MSNCSRCGLHWIIIKMQAWDVYLNGKCIDTVFFMKDCDKQYVLNSLINHDRYNPCIKIRKG